VQAVRRVSVSAGVVRKVALASVVLYALLVLTGGAVRLTGSGLGCPDWPSCYQHRLLAAVSFHPMVEDLNRGFTAAVSVVSIVALLVALLRRPHRRDISWPAFGLVVGLVAQIVLGGLVVLFKLNPYLVALHFVLTIAVLADAIWMYHRAGIPDVAATGPAEPVVSRDLRWMVRLLLGVLGIVTCAGTIVTGAGPHAGGPGAKRVPVAFRDIAELHSSLAWLLLGLVAASLFAFHQAKAPERVQRRARTMFELVVIQGALGYTQYFLHDASYVVELHLAGVTMLWIGAIGLYLSLHEHGVRTPAVPDLGRGGPPGAQLDTELVTPAPVA
jgi:cytochrome c oxidase assembly protein subunit 15